MEAALLEACLQLNRRLKAGACAGEADTTLVAAAGGKGAADGSSSNFAHAHLLRKQDPNGEAGEQYFAAAHIPAGTLLLVSSPVAMVLDTDVDASESTAWNADTALLIIAVAKAIAANHKVWEDEISTLFPRPPDMNSISHWQCDDEDPELGAHVEAALAKLTLLSAAERARIPDIVKYNSLSIESCPEQLCHAQRYGHLSGLGLYNLPSLFNHACKPNVARFNIGDLAVFRTNQHVNAGTELCISYIESELLSESASVRNDAIGNRDFKVTDIEADQAPSGGGGGCKDGSKKDGRDMEKEDEEKKEEEEEEEEEEEVYDGPVLPPDMLDAVRATHPLEQLATVKEVLEDAASVKRFHPSDHKELSLIQGLALAQLGSPSEALQHWEACLSFNQKFCPPHDEATVCYAFQAALCAYAADKADIAVRHMLVAVEAHAIAFGPGLPLFRARYATEIASLPTSLEAAAAMMDAMLSVHSVPTSELAATFLKIAKTKK